MKPSTKDDALPFTQASAETKPPVNGKRLAPITGSSNGTKPPPILADGSDAPSTADPSAPAQEKTEYASITAAETLALLQTDLCDLQAAGYSIAIVAREGSLYMKITPPTNDTLGWSSGDILLNSRKVKSG